MGEEEGRTEDAMTNAEAAWIVGNDTGASSETIWAVMMGVRPSGSFAGWPPSDQYDFGRCHRLLMQFPAWRARLPEVAEAYPAWKYLVAKWGVLTAMYMVHEDREYAPGFSETLRDLTQKAYAERSGQTL